MSPATPTSAPLAAIVRQFQRACLAVRIPHRDRVRYWWAYLGLAHRGVMLHSPERDAVYADCRWRRAYERYRGRIDARLAARAATAPPPVTEVPSFALDALSPADVRLLMRANVPFVLRDGARDLPARRWTLDHLEEVAGDAAVPINAAADQPSPDTSRPTKAHRYYQFRTGRLAEVARSIREGGTLRVSTAEDVMHHGGGRLRADLDLPFFERLSGWERNRTHWLKKHLLAGKVVGAQLMLQPENAFTLWHAEPGDNFFVLVQGGKTWTLAHPYYTAALQPRVKTTTNYHGSNVDVREDDATQRARGFAGYVGMPKVRVVLAPGDVLRVPNHWWHTVVTHPGHYTIAATIRCNSPPNRTGFGYGLLRLFDRQYHAMAQAYARDGRIRDEHIGYPRPGRTPEGESA